MDVEAQVVVAEGGAVVVVGEVCVCGKERERGGQDCGGRQEGGPPSQSSTTSNKRKNAPIAAGLPHPVDLPERRELAQGQLAEVGVVEAVDGGEAGGEDVHHAHLVVVVIYWVLIEWWW